MEKELLDFFDHQLENWKLAYDNFQFLRDVKKKPFSVGSLQGYVQFNPARAVSTMAKVGKEEIRNRKCFLCKDNRPSEQLAMEILPDWELLVNPFPILPYHFTISNRNHTPQVFKYEDGLKLSGTLPGMVVFFNGDGAGASAPDHLHYQAVPIEELPLVSLIEKERIENINRLNLPFQIIADKEEAEKREQPINGFFWKSPENGETRFIAIPRTAHRPKLFYLEDENRRRVSPGAIDMAGVIVTPFEEDYLNLSSQEIAQIYRDVALIPSDEK